MCGNVGCAGPLTAKNEKSIRTLLILDALRGIDSTGIAVVSRQGDVKIAKEVGDPYQLFDTKRYDKAISGINSVIIGHNRWATQGRINATNAHPFDVGDIVGAHNGTLNNKYHLHDHSLFDVDSENIFHSMSKKGVPETVGIMDGAWALVWYDKTDKTINFLRNKERPLYITMTEDDVLYWASEEWMLSIGLSREGIKYKEIVELETDQWMSIELAANGQLGKPHITPCATKSVKPVYQQHSNYRQGWANTGNVTKAVVEENMTVIDQTPLIPKATDSTSKSLTLPFVGPNPYKPQETVYLEVVGAGLDRQGAHYWVCRDRNYPENNIRLYKKNNDTIDYLGKFIECHIHQFRFTDKSGAYYKVEHSSVFLTEIGERKDVMFQDSKGKLITKGEWNDKHGVCAWCTGHVDPAQDFKFTSEGEAVCHLCVADKEVHQYVNFQ
jgi:hypothetical protein